MATLPQLDTLEALKRTSTATVTSQLLLRGLRNTFIAGLTPLRPDLRMAGYAFTLRYVPSREDIGIDVHYDNETNPQRIAIEAVGPEQVLVIDARGERRAASLGHILATRLLSRGAAGLVTDGALRDSHMFSQLDLPAYAAGAHATTSSVVHHPVDLNVPIGCGGVLVMPGDVVVGDAEGVVVVPAALADEVAGAALEQEEYEAFVLERVQDGASIKGLYPGDDKSRAEFDLWRSGHNGTKKPA
jgi:regulator of RNase E activity RraA